MSSPVLVFDFWRLNDYLLAAFSAFFAFFAAASIGFFLFSLLLWCSPLAIVFEIGNNVTIIH